MRREREKEEVLVNGGTGKVEIIRNREIEEEEEKEGKIIDKSERRKRWLRRKEEGRREKQK